MSNQSLTSIPSVVQTSETDKMQDSPLMTKPVETKPIIKRPLFYLILFLVTIIIGVIFIALEKSKTDSTTPTVTEQPKVINIEEVKWVKSGVEAKLPLGLPGTGDSKTILPGSIIKVNGEYKLWYTGIDDNNVWRIYMATSSDGLEWKKVDNSIPTASNKESSQGRIALGLEGSGDEGLTKSPSVIYIDGKYLMWYSGSNKNLKDNVFQATSLDGLTWTKTDNSMPERSDTIGKNGQIPLGNLGRGDDFNIDTVAVVAKDQDNFFAYYSGENNNQSGPSQVLIYLARSKDKGTTWEKVNNNVSTVSTEGRLAIGDAGSSDGNGIVYPSVIFNNGTFYIWYSGFQEQKEGEGDKITIMQAKSSDGLAWTKLSSKSAKTSDWLQEAQGVNNQTQLIANVVVYKDQNEVFLLYSAAPDRESPLTVYMARAE